MATTILILGESGSGKSSSIRNLDPSETAIINVLDKPLPFRGFRKKYIREVVDDKKINYFSTKDPNQIISAIRAINQKRTEIKTLIIDDFQYIMANYLFMVNASRSNEVFEKFRNIATFVWKIMDELQMCRQDMNCYVLSHSDLKEDGTYKAKTVGKMIDSQITFEGMFTLVLHSIVIENKYQFFTNDQVRLSKSPPGMFQDKYIDNDLNDVNKKIFDYFNEDINQ